VVPVLGALAAVMVVLPLVMAASAWIKTSADLPRLFLGQHCVRSGRQGSECTAPSVVKFFILLIVGILSLALGIAAAVLLLRDGPTHAALVVTMTLTALAVVMYLLLHVCAAKEEPKAVFTLPPHRGRCDATLILFIFA
jgi:heme A synthase